MLLTLLQVPELEKTRLNEVLARRKEEQKRREEADAKAMREKLAASEAQRKEAERLDAGMLCFTTYIYHVPTLRLDVMLA